MKNHIFTLKECLTTIVTVFFMFSLVGYSTETGHRTDGQTEGAIKRRLDMDTRVDPERIGVSVKNGHAQLFGTVETLEEKSLATNIASSVLSVQSVNNTISVEPKVSRDREIQNSVNQLIAILKIPSKKDITVQSAHGVVTLEGTVMSQKDKNRVSEAARSVKGVKEVQNLLKVVDSKRSDKQIYNDVIHYLLWSPLINADDFEVHVKNGIVSLQGSINHLVHKDVLVMDLENIHGVKKVDVGKVVPKPFKAFPAQSVENS